MILHTRRRWWSGEQATATRSFDQAPTLVSQAIPSPPDGLGDLRRRLSAAWRGPEDDGAAWHYGEHGVVNPYTQALGTRRAQ